MESSIEYISAGIIIALVLGLTVQFATNIVDTKVNAIEQESGFNIADKILDTLLLSAGKPNNWGEDVDPPSSMGLALDNAIKPYQLDFGKVRRLSNESANYIPPYMVRDLLGLSAYYYISIKVMPIYTIAVTNITAEKFSIRITNRWSAPVSNVNVTGAYVDMDEVDSNDVVSFMEGNLEDAMYKYNTTESSGNCSLNFAGAGSRKTLIVMADQLNIRSIVTWPAQSDSIIDVIESSMGPSTNFNVETVSRNVEIDALNYIVLFTIWWS